MMVDKLSLSLLLLPLPFQRQQQQDMVWYSARPEQAEHGWGGVKFVSRERKKNIISFSGSPHPKSFLGEGIRNAKY